MLITTLPEVKALLEVDADDSSQDLVLNFLIEMASDWILGWLNRKEIAYGFRSEFYDGKGTQRLVLRTNPAFVDANRPITVIVDDNGGYGSIPGTFASGASGNALVYGQDFFLQLDSPDQTKSRCGILIRNGSYWQKNRVRSWGLLTSYSATAFGTISVSYWGGLTAEELPAQLRWACDTLVARMRFSLPVGYALTGDTYMEKTINILTGSRDAWMRDIYGVLQQYRNFKFGT